MAFRRFFQPALLSITAKKVKIIENPYQHANAKPRISVKPQPQQGSIFITWVQDKPGDAATHSLGTWRQIEFK